MLCGLVAVNDVQDQGWSLHVAHLDHGLRPEAAADARFVHELATSLSLDCTIDTADIMAESRAVGGTLEEVARRARYAFLERAATDIGASVVAVGHHADDQAETVLHHIARGTGLRGLAGMATRRPISQGSSVALVRPLLGLRRAELRDYLGARGITFREDATNAEPAATRNRIRHRILPAMEQELNPRVVSSLTRLAGQARRTDEALSWIAAEVFNRCRIRNGEQDVVLSADDLGRVPRGIQAAVVHLALRRLGAGLQSIGHERIEAACELLTNDASRRTVEMAGGAFVRRCGRELRIARRPEIATSGGPRRSPLVAALGRYSHRTPAERD